MALHKEHKEAKVEQVTGPEDRQGRSSAIDETALWKRTSRGRGCLADAGSLIEDRRALLDWFVKPLLLCRHLHS